MEPITINANATTAIQIAIFGNGLVMTPNETGRDGGGLSSEVWSSAHTIASSGYSAPQYGHFFIGLLYSMWPNYGYTTAGSYIEVKKC